MVAAALFSTKHTKGATQTETGGAETAAGAAVAAHAAHAAHPSRRVRHASLAALLAEMNAMMDPAVLHQTLPRGLQ